MFSLLWFSILGCAHLPPFPAPPVDHGVSAELPLVHVPDDPVRLYVRLPGLGDSLWFLDTGYASTTCDSDWVAAQGLSTRTSLVYSRGSLGYARLSKVSLPDFELGGHRVSKLHCAVRDLQATSSISDPRVAGVLGTNLLSRFVVEVDMEAGVLRLHDPAEQGLEEGVRLRRQLTNGRALVDLELDGERARPVLDYGATGTYLDAGRLELMPAVQRESVWRGTGSRGPELRTLAYHPVLEPRLLGEAGPPIEVVDHPWRPGQPGLVGMNVLENYRVVIDYPHRRIVAEPVTPARLPVDREGLPPR